MQSKVELPIVEPIYSTYHSQGSGAAIIAENPTIRNWYLNQAVSLTCTKKFLSGFTTPQINIENSSLDENIYLYKQRCYMRFAKGYINVIIREMLKQGCYVFFCGIDDYYIEGKTWYKERHFAHDGLIYGYDNKKKTYLVFAYDNNWVYNKFEVSQKSFNKGRLAMAKLNQSGHICALKAVSDKIVFEPETVIKNLKEYLNPSLEKHPKTEDGTVYGIVVHDYIAMYIDKLYDGSIPYKRMDRRVFRLIWEHKKVMLERIEKLEEKLHFDSELSMAYKKLVSEADTMRMLYASHFIKRRDTLLPIISKKLLSLKSEEKIILEKLIKKAKDAENE